MTESSLEQIRRNVDNMSSEDAVYYLLGLVEDTFPALSGTGHEVDKWSTNLTKSERLVLCALYDAAPRWLTYDQIISVIATQGNPDVIPDQQLAKVYACRIRKKVSRAFGRIETMWGHGYKFVPAIDGAMLS